MKIILPASLNPISRRKDKSVKLSFETREVSPEETLSLMAVEGAEMWLCLSTNPDDIEVPEGRAELETKTPSQRQKAVLYKLFLQETGKSKYLGTFDNFYSEMMERIIESWKDKLDS